MLQRCSVLALLVIVAPSGCADRSPIAPSAPIPAAAAPARPAEPPAPGVPAVFAPGVISGPSRDSVPTFTPDGNTVYFTRDDAIMIAERRGATWSEPEVAPFSGRWGDWEPAMAPDGSFLIFASNRPAVEPGTALDGEWGYPTRRVFKSHGANLWRVDRRGAGWGPPVRLPDTVNRGTAVWEPGIVGDGSLYFMDAHLTGRFRLYRSQLRDGVYQEPEPLAFNDGAWSDVDTTVAPDESFLVVASNRPPADAKTHDLFIAFRTGNGDWGELVHLGSQINDAASPTINPRLGPDRRTLYFTSERRLPVVFPRTPAAAAADLRRSRSYDNGAANIWQVDLSPWLDRGR